MDSDNNSSDTESKPKLEDVLLLNNIYCSDQKQKKRYYGKKRYKNVKTLAKVKITEEDLENMIVDDLNGQYFPGYVKYFKSHYKDCLDESMKSSQNSIKARIKANKLFMKPEHSAQIHKDIWELYCKSVAFAPIGSKELVLAYECRSTLLLHLKKYEDCVKDINRALSLTNFDLLKAKLLCRKMTCLVAMNRNTEEKLVLLKTLNSHVNKVDVAFKDEKFMEMIYQAMIDSKIQPVQQNNIEKCPNCSISCSNNVDMIFNKQIRMIANQDYAPGDKVICTKPLVTCTNPHKFYGYCSHCLSFMWAGIPCIECSLCMYCSEECKAKDWEKYHSLECKILPHINFESIHCNNMHLSIRVLFKALKEYGSISKLKEKMQEVDELRDNSKLGKNMSDSEFVQFYASVNSSINNNEYNLDQLYKLTMKACFSVFCIIQTCDIFKSKNFKSFRGKELSKEQEIIDCGFVLLKIMILNKLNSKAAGQVYTTFSKCDKYEKTTECSKKRHCIRGSYYDIYNAMFEKSCNPNVARCTTDDGKIIYYCVQPIKKMEKITICQNYDFFMHNKTTRVTYTYFSKYCQCTACLKDWPLMKELFEKTKQRRLKSDSRETKIVEKYLKRNQLNASLVQDKNCNFDEQEYKVLLQDVNDVIKVCGQPSFASSLMIEYLCKAFEKRHGTISLISRVPAKC